MIDIRKCTIALFRFPSRLLWYVDWSAVLLSLIVAVQPADPAWESFPIPNAHLASHLDTEEVMPPMNVPGRRYITSFDPATGLHIGTFLADNEEEIRGKIERAGNAQEQWRNTNFTQRRRVIRSLLKWLVDNQELCARVACRDSGKTRELPEFSKQSAFTEATKSSMPHSAKS
jgi:hypothetical protein